MDRAIFAAMAATQQTHWWFAARRKILGKVIASLALPSDASILEIGCGSGANLAMLRRFGTVSAVEQDEYAAYIARQVGGVEVRVGGLPDAIPVAGQKFDLVCLLDVLEHIEDDAAALRAVSALMGNDGRILLTIPAYSWLYSSHDRRHHHFRRYTACSIERLSKTAGLRVDRVGYYNAMLFPLALMRRLLDRWSGQGGDDHVVPTPLLNHLLRKVFAAESRVVGKRFFPFGLSVIAILRAA